MNIVADITGRRAADNLCNQTLVSAVRPYNSGIDTSIIFEHRINLFFL
jgi:hypothetical protein